MELLPSEDEDIKGLYYLSHVHLVNKQLKYLGLIKLLGLHRLTQLYSQFNYSRTTEHLTGHYKVGNFHEKEITR